MLTSWSRIRKLRPVYRTSAARERVTEVRPGDHVLRLGRADGCERIYIPDQNYSGYLPDALKLRLSTARGPRPRLMGSFSADEGVEEALRLAESCDAPYRWGGLTERGFDCSGLVWHLFEKQGVLLPRDAWMQFARICGALYFSSGNPPSRDRVLPRGAVRAGDVVFFSEDERRVDHVGLAVSEYAFVHASRNNQERLGRGLAVTRFDGDAFYGPLYAQRFVGARRFRI